MHAFVLKLRHDLVAQLKHRCPCFCSCTHGVRMAGLPLLRGNRWGYPQGGEELLQRALEMLWLKVVTWHNRRIQKDAAWSFICSGGRLTLGEFLGMCIPSGALRSHMSTQPVARKVCQCCMLVHTGNAVAAIDIGAGAVGVQGSESVANALGQASAKRICT